MQASRIVDFLIRKQIQDYCLTPQSLNVAAQCQKNKYQLVHKYAQRGIIPQKTIRYRLHYRYHDILALSLMRQKRQPGNLTKLSHYFNKKQYHTE